MKAKEDKLSLVIGYPSIALQFVIPPLLMSGIESSWSLVLVWLLVPLTALGCVIAFVLYAKAKGHSPLYGALGVVWPVAIIVITCLPDVRPDGADQGASVSS